MWKTALGAEADLVTITSYNEWQEGTQIEPAQVQADRPGYDGAWGRTGWRPAGRTSTRRRLDSEAPRDLVVERRRESLAVRDRDRVVLPEVIEDRDRQLA